MAAKKTNRVNGKSLSGRDSRGLFQKGNPGGPGNPKVRRIHELKQAVRDAVSADDLKAVMVGLVDRANGGDNDASRILLDRILGRPFVGKPDAKPLNVGLPEIRSARDCVAATSRILRAMDRGEVDTDDAGRLSGLIELARRTIETSELERRVEEIEARLKGKR